MNSESKLILDEIRQLNSKNKKILKSIEPEEEDFKKSKTEYQVYLELKLKNPSPHNRKKEITDKYFIISKIKRLKV